LIGGSLQWHTLHSIIKGVAKNSLFMILRCLGDVAPNGVEKELKNRETKILYESLTEALDSPELERFKANFAEGSRARVEMEGTRDIVCFGLDVDEPYRKLFMIANKLFNDKLQTKR
jgi:hypothetical protein